VVFQQEPVGLPLAVAIAVAHTLQQERAAADPDPFARRDGWRAFGVAVRRFGFEFAGAPLQAQLTYEHDGSLMLALPEQQGRLSVLSTGTGLDVQFGSLRSTAFAYRLADWVHIFTPQGATRILEIDLLAHAGDRQAEGGRLTAPMPGKVLSFAVKSGDTVRRGQALAVLEAMKMEHTIAAPADGTVAELLYAPGDQVSEGAELLTLRV
jgi:3-methylcrotonyl-CoA carboxylase alpha subunit